MKVVAVVESVASYPTQPPFSPSTAFPEYPFGLPQAQEANTAYDGVRRLLHLLGMDPGNYDTAAWNPLGAVIAPGMTVVIKPNFVLSRHRDGKSLFAIITHPAILRAVGDYAWIALKGQGHLIFADAPQYDCDWEELMRATHMEDVVRVYRQHPGPSVTLLDLRWYWSRWKHFASLLQALPGDPQGAVTVNLGRRSALFGKPHPEKLYGAVYHRTETIAHHTGDIQEYELSRTVLTADVVISVPKLKVHKKVGVTLNAKGLVGICTNKNYLVHYSVTPPSEGGDQYPDRLLNRGEEAMIKTERWMYDNLLAPRKPFLEYLHRSLYALHNRTTRRLGIKVSEKKRLLDAGNWYGNDSAWRMAVDLMRLFFLADKHGTLQNGPQRRTFTVIDGIVGGENNGPLSPDPLGAGVLIGSDSFLAADIVATRLMGFDPLKVRVLAELLQDSECDFGIRGLADIRVLAANPAWANCLNDTTSSFLHFKPHPGWIGHLEIAAPEKPVR